MRLREEYLALLADAGMRVELSQLDALTEFAQTLKGFRSKIANAQIDATQRHLVEDALTNSFMAVANTLSEIADTILNEPLFPIQVFLCHSSGDKAAVRELCTRLLGDGFSPWLDEEKLLPGQEWDTEIRKAVRSSDVVIVCLSNGAITKEGYVQREIRHALDAAEEKPPGTIFVVPLKLEQCDVPARLREWHWVALFEANGYAKLIQALRARQRDITCPRQGAQSREETFSSAAAKIWHALKWAPRRREMAQERTRPAGVGM